MGTLKAIQTVYNGYRFRSRLEARWAVYFDAIGLEWDYETEGFELQDGTRYLPDFWLPQVEMWAEVKPNRFDDEAREKLALLAIGTGFAAIMLDGVPECRSYLFFDPSPEMLACSGHSKVYETDCFISMFHQYPISEHRFYSDTGELPYVTPDSFARKHSDCFDDIPPAVAAARSARFEHNERQSSIRMQRQPFKCFKCRRNLREETYSPINRRYCRFCLPHGSPGRDPEGWE